MAAVEVFSLEDARQYAEYMYDPAFTPGPDQAEWVHTALAATAGYNAFRTYNDHVSTSGKHTDPDPSMTRDMLANHASSEVDRILATKALNFIDIQRAKTHAVEEAIYLVTQQSDALAQSEGEAASYFHPELATRSGPAPPYHPPSSGPPQNSPGPGHPTPHQAQHGSDRAALQQYPAPQGPPPGHPTSGPARTTTHQRTPSPRPVPATREIGILYPPRRRVGLVHSVIEGSFQHPGPQYVELEPHRHQDHLHYVRQHLVNSVADSNNDALSAMALASATGFLEVFAPLAELIPVVGTPVKAAVEATSKIMKYAKEVQSNKEKTKDLANLTQTWVKQLVHMLSEPEIQGNKAGLHRLIKDLSEVLMTLKSIEEATGRMSQQGRWKRARNKEKDAEELVKLRAKFEETIKLFDVASHVQIRTQLVGLGRDMAGVRDGVDQVGAHVNDVGAVAEDIHLNTQNLLSEADRGSLLEIYIEAVEDMLTHG